MENAAPPRAAFQAPAGENASRPGPEGFTASVKFVEAGKEYNQMRPTADCFTAPLYLPVRRRTRIGY